MLASLKAGSRQRKRARHLVPGANGRDVFKLDLAFAAGKQCELFNF